MGAFSVEPNEVQQGSGEDSGEGRQALVQSQVRFNRIPIKILEKVLGGFGAVSSVKPSQVEQCSGKGSGGGVGGLGAKPNQF